MAYERTAPKARKRGRSGRKPQGLTAEGSTRAWRSARESIPGPKRCVVCGTTRNLQANHKKARKAGGTDEISNLEWRCVKHQTNVGRPKKGSGTSQKK